MGTLPPDCLLARKYTDQLLSEIQYEKLFSEELLFFGRSGGVKYTVSTRRKVINDTLEKYGRIDILVNNASFQVGAALVPWLFWSARTHSLVSAAFLLLPDRNMFLD